MKPQKCIKCGTYAEYLEERRRVMERNAELVRQLKQVKQALVAKELQGEEWEEMQQAVAELEKVVSYINDCTGKGIEF